MKQGIIKKLTKLCLCMAMFSFSVSGYAHGNLFAQKNASAQLLPSEAFLLASTFSVPPSGVVLGEGNLLFAPPGPPPGTGGGIGGAVGEAPVGNGLWGMICCTLAYAFYSRRRTSKINHEQINKQITNKI